MSVVVRKASPAAKVFWWFMFIHTCGVYALFRGYPK